MKTRRILLLLTPFVLFIFFELTARLAWSIATEWHHGYYHNYKWSREFLFTPERLLPTRGTASNQEKLIDLTQELHLPVGEKPSVTKSFPELDFSTSDKIIIKSLNTLIEEPEFQKRFIAIYQDALNWKNPEISSLAEPSARTQSQNQRLTRLMLENMLPLYQKFPYGYFFAHKPLDRFFYGKESSMSLFHDHVHSMDILKPMDPGAVQMVILGGSTAKCTGVNPSQCWSTYLEEKLNQHHTKKSGFPKFQVRNLGISSGSSTDSKQGFLNAHQSIKNPLRTDYLLWYEGLNDVFYFTEHPEMKDLLIHGAFKFTKPKNASQANFLSRCFLYLYQHSALFYLSFQLKQWLIKKVPLSSLKKKEEVITNTIAAEIDREQSIQIAAQLNTSNLESVSPFVRKRIFMFSIPLPKDIKKRRFHLDYEAKALMFSHLKKYAASKQIPFGDVAPAIETEKVEEVFTSDRVHLNAYGNYLLADEIFRFILPIIEKDYSRSLSEITGA